MALLGAKIASCISNLNAGIDATFGYYNNVIDSSSLDGPDVSASYFLAAVDDAKCAYRYRNAVCPCGTVGGTINMSDVLAALTDIFTPASGGSYHFDAYYDPSSPSNHHSVQALWLNSAVPVGYGNILSRVMTQEDACDYEAANHTTPPGWTDPGGGNNNSGNSGGGAPSDPYQ
jgi:hypothetical protein